MKEEIKAKDCLIPSEMLEYQILIEFLDLIEKIDDDMVSSKIEDGLYNRMNDLKWAVGDRMLKWFYDEIGNDSSVLRKYLDE